MVELRLQLGQVGLFALVGDHLRFGRQSFGQLRQNGGQVAAGVAELVEVGNPGQQFGGGGKPAGVVVGSFHLLPQFGQHHLHLGRAELFAAPGSPR